MALFVVNDVYLFVTWFWRGTCRMLKSDFCFILFFPRTYSENKKKGNCRNCNARMLKLWGYGQTTPWSHTCLHLPQSRNKKGISVQAMSVLSQSLCPPALYTGDSKRVRKSLWMNEARRHDDQLMQSCILYTVTVVIVCWLIVCVCVHVCVCLLKENNFSLPPCMQDA